MAAWMVKEDPVLISIKGMMPRAGLLQMNWIKQLWRATWSAQLPGRDHAQ